MHSKKGQTVEFLSAKIKKLGADFKLRNIILSTNHIARNQLLLLSSAVFKRIKNGL